MSISQEEKNFLIEQIENLTSSRPLFYLKFCKCEKYAQDIYNGDLYGNTAEYFRRLELESGERGQGDQFELLLSIQAENMAVINKETGNVVFSAPKSIFRVQFTEDNLTPIVSFVGASLRDMEIINADETHVDLIFPFTDIEYKTMTERFGEYCVILDAREVEARIAAYCNYFRFEYIFDKVKYCNQNTLDRMQAFNKRAKERFLYKNSDLEYQREYRLAVARKIPEDHFIKLGAFYNATVINSIELKNLIFSIEYTSQPKVDE